MASSVTTATAELVAERIAATLRLPPLSSADRGAVVELLIAWCAKRTAAAVDAERRESERLRAEVEQRDRELARLRGF